ncbi:siderophore/surfactin synthetase related protein [Lachnospiraceae bacterium KM106-2]|nr:siderophore/surfactin synthetase related protein [Lachnospiraceae bacterium KM106-2]
MAVYYVAIKEGLDYSLHTLYAPIDTRRYAKNPRRFGLCNQMGNLYTTIENLDDLSFLELLQAIHVQMESEKQSGNCLKELRLLHLAFRILPHKWSARIIGRSVKNPRVALTNLGIIDEKALSFQGVETKDCFISGSMKYASNLQMAVSTYQNEITFGVNMMVSPEDKKNISILLNSYRDILVRIAKGEL